MAVYLIAEGEIVNTEVFSEYTEKLDEVLKKYGGRFLARGASVIPVSGNWNPKRITVVEFDTYEQLMICLTSVEYLEIAALREQSLIYKAIVVEGCKPSEEE